MTTKVEPALYARGVRKSFDANPALRGVDLEVARGSIHALLGGNGSGKSTLIKILAGVHTADDGSLSVHGSEIDARRANPVWAARVGLRFVHQDLGLFGTLSVGENLVAGRRYASRFGRIDWPAVRHHAGRLLDRFGIPARPEQRLDELSQAERTLVAIARALRDDEPGEAVRTVLVLDEPTSCLPADQAAWLLDALRGYAADGHTIVMVSHRLNDVVGVAHAATVLRDGQNAATLPEAEITEDRIIELIAGGQALPPRRSTAPGGASTAAGTAATLRVAGVRTGTHSSVTFECRPGEIVGIAGMLGSGRSRLLRSIFGAQDRASGTVSVGDRAIRPGSIRAAIADGIAYVPENRACDAAFPDQPIQANMSVVGIGSYWRGLRLRLRRERCDARRDSARFHIAAGGASHPLASLSGGNQQKVILARWLRTGPRVLLLDEPTQGVDVRARAEIHALIGAAAADGAVALVVSSDFAELAALCDRVLVLRGGEIVADLPRAELSEHTLTSLAAKAAAPAIPD